ncbi:abc transporter g family member 28 [Holotrichia oblita]|uniref:Abc transporter g family member 28 n=1 Tax=Holotrichia oblita TaxID=644536 RepID=A0ACB9TA49_HOLOL|nr:abc transporter g family member 28 [Holotrichia oblita]
MSVMTQRKEILHGVAGEFKSGQLSAIMGPSGAGKSTLLNILAGYITRGSSGNIMMNNQIRDDNPKFRKLVAYIPQDEELRLSLTAIENMTVAAHLKLGYDVTDEYKTKQVVQIMQLLGLEACHNTMTSRLSGGQRKRLAIALELLSNPPILFLDEPTTGLDSLSCTQCVCLLKRLAEEGRTVVCTIHQPSALIFEKFDKLYALSEGVCIYDGTIGNLLPHLSGLGLTCPPYHNPADFLMEVAIGEHGVTVEELSNAEITQQSRKSITGVRQKHDGLCRNAIQFTMVQVSATVHIICTWSYIVITYWLTDQPTDYRVYFFVVFCTLSTLCAQAWGYFIGATTPIKIAVFLGPVLACLFSIFGFCIRYLDTPVMFRWMYTISYFRAGFQGLVYSIYGLPRPKLYCPETAVYCHYQSPKDFLGEMDMEDVNLWSNISMIIIISFLMHAFTYAAVWFKLHKR